MSTYEELLASKRSTAPSVGVTDHAPLDDRLFPHQRDLVSWALRRGKAAIFADTGLGKSRMEIEWALHVVVETNKPVMILAPLAVARQMVSEGETVGVAVKLCRDGSDVSDGINVTNYDRLHRFDAASFGGVVLDESSIIKHHDAKTLAVLMAAFRDTRFKLCATATPAPNDFTELGTHAEFLGVCSRQEMLAEYFVHDGGSTQDWRLKGHAREAFWRWVASWGAVVRHPRDLGYDTDGYDLPPLVVTQHTVEADDAQAHGAGLLFVEPARTLSERRAARRGSIAARVAACVATVAAEPDEPWIVWCELNAESEALAKAIPGCVEVRGSDDVDEKERRLAAFTSGEARAIVSKPSICGHGLNWQRCARIAFVGVTDSFEQYYQAIRRCWRFGQTRPVHVHVFSSTLEGNVVDNLKRKEADAAHLAAQVSAETAEAVRAQIRGSSRLTHSYAPVVRMTIPAWIRSEAA